MLGEVCAAVAVLAEASSRLSISQSLYVGLLNGTWCWRGWDGLGQLFNTRVETLGLVFPTSLPCHKTFMLSLSQAAQPLS